MAFNYEEEEIEGYLVTSKMKKIWAVELNLLKKFDEACKKYNIKYHVCYGTLLGAVRHQGFIPWDDDIDVFILRDDYMRLLQIGPQEFKEPYFFQNAYTDSMIWGFSKLRDSRTTAIEFQDKEESFNQGIFIDIFPLDVTDDGTPKMQMITNIKRDIWDCIYNRPAILNNIDNPEIWKMFTIDKSMVLELINMSYQDTLKCFEDFCLSNLDATNHLRCWSSEVMGNLYKHYEKEWFEDLMEVPFCDTTVPISREFARILTMEYGDWKTPVRGGTLHNNMIVDPDMPYKEWLRNHR
ncbi:MAG: phosphorylcholine transferase LicD [Lachnospiraceae bacterium]